MGTKKKSHTVIDALIEALPAERRRVVADGLTRLGVDINGTK
jgi:TRAP-type C4-dicarboxylate transport system permease small subunit